MKAETRNLIAFLRRVGYPGLAQNVEDQDRIAHDLREKAQVGIASESELQFLEFQARFEESLKEFDWLRDYAS